MNILQSLDDPNVFSPHFKDPGSWAAWRAFLAALFGLPLDQPALATYRACTGRAEPQAGPHDEAWLICGRRGGKSLMLATIAVFLSSFRDWRPYLAPGERATVMVIAADRRQARTIMRYVLALLENVPMLARTVERSSTEAIELRNRVSIEVHTASFRTTRGYTVVAALCDEIAFWRSEDSASPDTEILAALRPSMATVPGAMLLCASSPYARRGALWEAYSRHHGKDSPALVWQAPTRTMNPTIPEHVVSEALIADPAHASAEYLAEFRSDVETFVAIEAVQAVVAVGVRELPAVSGGRYHAFVDPSGGSADSMTLAIAHGDAVLDVVREVRPPFSPEAVVQEFSELLHRYGVRTVHGDRYAAEWCQEQFRKRGIGYEPADRSKSELYRDLLPIINSRQCELLDNDRLIHQLVGLERKTARGGRDSINHPPGAHDDVANAVAGALVYASRPRQELLSGVITGYGCGPVVPIERQPELPSSAPRSSIRGLY